MPWEILAMWAIVSVTVVWFIRDEKRLRHEARLRKAAAYYAHAPQYRHVRVEPVPQTAAAPRPRTNLNRNELAFIAALKTSRETARG